MISIYYEVELYAILFVMTQFFFLFNLLDFNFIPLGIYKSYVLFSLAKTLLGENFDQILLLYYSHLFKA